MSAKIIDSKLTFRKGFKKLELGGNDISWVYLQAENGSGQMCCGSYAYIIYRVMVLGADGSRYAFPFEEEKPAKALLANIAALGENIAVGFTPENKARFGVQ